MKLKIALPKGRLMTKTQALLEKAGLDIRGYHDQTRYYHLTSESSPDLSARIFHEKDIPIQVAIGNYDIGICGLDWIEELIAKYPSSALVKIKKLGYGVEGLYAAVLSSNGGDTDKDFSNWDGNVRIAGEYPNLAESLAEKLRLKRFCVFPLWGAVEAYPPENAELVILPAKGEKELQQKGFKPVVKMLMSQACLIANKNSLKTKDMSMVVASITENIAREERVVSLVEDTDSIEEKQSIWEISQDTVRMALPDGHQQPHVKKIMEAADIEIADYPSVKGKKRPVSPTLKDFLFKLIRPQDMPLQVANGNFDMAITGRDWLTEHLYQFPSSPIEEVLDLKYGRVRIVAVVSNSVPVDTPYDYREYYYGKTVRIASEYINIADYYARNNHLSRYRIIPTWGATEAFVPGDADMMIENTETGGTIRRHNLKIVDTLFESTACIVVNKKSVTDSIKRVKVEGVLNRIEKALEKLS